MTPQEFVDSVAKLAKTNECPSCLTPLSIKDESWIATCPNCGTTSDLTSYKRLREQLNYLIQEARNVE